MLLCVFVFVSVLFFFHVHFVFTNPEISLSPEKKMWIFNTRLLSAICPSICLLIPVQVSDHRNIFLEKSSKIHPIGRSLATRVTFISCSSKMMTIKSILEDINVQISMFAWLRYDDIQPVSKIAFVLSQTSHTIRTHRSKQNKTGEKSIQ